jgi:hypothetical protein
LKEGFDSPTVHQILRDGQHKIVYIALCPGPGLLNRSLMSEGWFEVRFLQRAPKKTLDKKSPSSIMIIVSETERDRNMMNFVKYDTNAIDIKTAWMATNAESEVDIIENINDKYELWIGKNFVEMYETFDIAKRNAEAKVSFTVKLEG